MSNPSPDRANAAPAAQVSGPLSATTERGGAARAPDSRPSSASEPELSPSPLEQTAYEDSPSTLRLPNSVSNHVEQTAWARGPIRHPTSGGPSLLSRALATDHNNSPLDKADAELMRHDELSRVSSTSQHTPPGSYSERNTNPATQMSIDQRDQDSGEALTPRASPRTSLKASASTNPTTSAAQRPLASSNKAVPSRDIIMKEVGLEPKGYHEPSMPVWEGHISTDRTEDRQRVREDEVDRPSLFGGMSAVAETVDSPRPIELASGQRSLTFDGSNFQGASTPKRPRKPDHRLSMGPEKAWSIGAGDLGNRQDGQVEKSIAEVLTGVEPNTRSRKASHSLRFFKEGLPEDGKRKDGKSGTISRDKLSPTREHGLEASRLASEEKGAAESYAAPSSSTSQPLVMHRVPRTKSYPAQSPLGPSISEAPEDSSFFKTNAKAEQKTELEGTPARADIESPALHGSQLKREVTPQPALALESRRKSTDGAEGEGSNEDGDDSGEDQISSAVFLPHQGLEETPSNVPCVPGAPPRLPPGSRTLSRADTFHPWLVKADEPEVIDQREDRGDVDAQPQKKQAVAAGVPDEINLGTDEEPVAVKETEPAFHPPKPSRTTSQYYEDHVHEHQLAPKQPLEAIELIPYKHQVGGHTTIWRFSKRAVCKQLNNRENEFYETIERDHPDLLAFLPRYIGVLNVTFEKRNRRKSTFKREDHAASERKQVQRNDVDVAVNPPVGLDDGITKPAEVPEAQGGHARIISQSLQSAPGPVPTVTFVDNQHILPRYLLQPSQAATHLPGRFKSLSIGGQETQTRVFADPLPDQRRHSATRPSLEDHHAHSWGATTVNKRLRNEVFNDAFLKQPIAIQRHRKGHQRSLPPRTMQHALRPAISDSSLVNTQAPGKVTTNGQHEKQPSPTGMAMPRAHAQQDQSQPKPAYEPQEGQDIQDVTGTSAPEPEIALQIASSQHKKRRHSGSALRRKPKDVTDSRGNLMFFEEADDTGYKGDNEEGAVSLSRAQSSEHTSWTDVNGHGPVLPLEEMANSSTIPSGVTSDNTSPTPDVKLFPRPINPKEAQTQSDSRVEYFLLLEDLTAGMKRPCIMDLKMGTRQYGVEASPSKQKSQQGKCAKTTSRELGVRVCGLQVWDVREQGYVFKDKYFGRDIKAGPEFQDALTRFLYNGVDPSSILRHIPTVLHKLSQLEVIISRLRGYRFYAASLLMFYDGDPAPADDEDVDDDLYSTTDVATDTEEGVQRRPRKRDRREIDFKIADFANSVTAGDLAADKPCPQQHPDQPDRGFLRGLRSLRRYFLRIQRETRVELGLATTIRNGLPDDDDTDEDEYGSVSE